MGNDRNKKQDSVHQNHRQRMYNRLENAGIESFADHEILELLLFFTIPRRDVNPLAHKLIREYGSLSGVLDANIDILQKTEGITHRTAILLNLIPQLLRRYNLDKIQPRSPLNSSEKSCKYAKALMIGKSSETCYLLCLDNRNHLINAVFIKEGTPNELLLNPRSIVIAATKHEAVSIILVHNHPRGDLQPSYEDISCTRKIALALGVIGIELLDHIIVSEEDVLSFKKENLMEEIIKSVTLRIETDRSVYN